MPIYNLFADFQFAKYSIPTLYMSVRVFLVKQISLFSLKYWMIFCGMVTESILVRNPYIIVTKLNEAEVGYEFCGNIAEPRKEQVLFK